MARFLALPLMVVMISMFSHSSAYVFYVGGSKGWVPDPSESYNNWAQRMRYQVNDSLVFRYNKESDSVLVVTKDAYNSCNTSNPIQRYEDGNSEFKFDRSGPFYFISGAPGNCEKGQKLVLVVLAVRNNKGQITPAPKSSPPSSSPSPTASPTSPPVPPSSPPTVSLAPSPVSLPPSSPPTASLAPSPVSLPPSSPPTASLAPSSSPAVPPSTSPAPSSSSPASPPSPSSLAPSPSTPAGPSPASSPSGQSPTGSPVSGPPSPPAPPISPSISPSGSNPASGGSSGNETSPSSHAPPPSASWPSSLSIGFASMLLAFLSCSF